MSVELHTIVSVEDRRIEEVAVLFSAMYAEMGKLGPVVPLVSGGAELWIRSVSSGLERFGRLCIATEGEVVVGFAHGTLKLAPEYQGGHRIGLITHVYVKPEHRRSGAAHALADALEDWFRIREVKGIELHVVEGNGPGLSFWRSRGYRSEILQLAKR
jgi:ribosomal protein S18 acetylase RimI-like enzyme